MDLVETKSQTRQSRLLSISDIQLDAAAGLPWHIETPVLLSLFRLLGADFALVGNAVISKTTSDNVPVLVQPNESLKPTLPVVTGIDGENLVQNMTSVGNNASFMLCGGLYGAFSFQTIVSSLRRMMDGRR